LLDRIDFVQDFTRDTQHFFACWSDGHQMLAIPSKHFNTQLFLQQTDLLGDSGLRSEETLGGSGNVEVVISDFTDIPKLLQFHLFIGFLT
jgi:hypothetical protein